MKNYGEIDFHSGEDLSLCSVRQEVFEKIKQDTEKHLDIIRKLPIQLNKKIQVSLTGGSLRDFLLKPSNIRDLDVHIDLNLNERNKNEYIQLFNSIPITLQIKIFDSIKESIPEGLSVDFGGFDDGKFWNYLFREQESSKYDKNFDFILNSETKIEAQDRKLLSSYSEKVKALIMTKVFEFHYSQVLKEEGIHFKDLFSSDNINFNIKSLKEEFNSLDANDIFKKINKVDIGEPEKVKNKRIDAGNKLLSYNLISGISSIFKFNPGNEFHYSQDLILSISNTQNFINSFDWDICKLSIPLSFESGLFNEKIRNLSGFIKNIEMDLGVKEALTEKTMTYSFFDVDWEHKMGRISDRIKKMLNSYPDFKSDFVFAGINVLSFKTNDEKKSIINVTEDIQMLNTIVKAILIENEFPKLTSKDSEVNIDISYKI